MHTPYGENIGGFEKIFTEGSALPVIQFLHYFSRVEYVGRK